MRTIPASAVLEQLPVAELEESLRTFLEPMVKILPAKRLGRVVALAVPGIGQRIAGGDADGAGRAAYRGGGGGGSQALLPLVGQ